MGDREVYYFGDGRLPHGEHGAGHHLWMPSAVHRGGIGWAIEREDRLPWSVRELDSGLAGDPALADPRRPGYWDSEDQPEGIVRLHHRDGWSAIAFWDRSGDQRYASNSVFLARGDFTAREMVLMFEEAFPAVWARITARLELRLPLEAPAPADAPLASTGMRIETPRLRVAEPVTAPAVELADLVEPESDDATATRRQAVVGGAAS